jgi:hypothetical protein
MSREPGMMSREPGMMAREPGMMAREPGMMAREPGMMTRETGMMQPRGFLLLTASFRTPPGAETKRRPFGSRSMLHRQPVILPTHQPRYNHAIGFRYGVVLAAGQAATVEGDVCDPASSGPECSTASVVAATSAAMKLLPDSMVPPICVQM